MPCSLTGGKSTPSFNRFGTTGEITKGWYMRTLFSVGNTQDLFSDASAWYDTSNFDGIAELVNSYGPSGAINADIAQGDAVFPPYYWKSGKSIRIKGCLLVTSTSAQDLNVQIGLVNSNSGSTVIAMTNNGNPHNFAKQGARSDVPVFFEFTIRCITNDCSPVGGDFLASAAGHYQYEFNDYNTTGSNLAPVFVPVYDANGWSIISSDFYTYTTRPFINFYNSTVTNLKIIHMTIEELS